MSQRMPQQESTESTVQWADVTLREFAALDLIRDPEAISRLNRYWDYVHSINPLRGPEPTRLTPHGEEWLKELHGRYSAHTTAAEAISMAQDVIRSLGTLAVMGAKR